MSRSSFQSTSRRRFLQDTTSMKLLRKRIVAAEGAGLEVTMRMMGAPSIASITRNFVQRG